MTNFEIQLFTHYPTLTKIWKASDGAYFVKLKDVQAYSNTLPDNTFIEILRPDNLPPLPDDVLPLNVNWVEFPFLWQFRGDFQISGADFDLETPGDNNKMWVYRIVADIPSRQKSITQNGVVMTVVAGDYIMSDGSKWSKIFDNKRVADLESNKVDKVTGKGLSSNDFTSAYKSALDGLSTVLEGKANVNNPVFTGSVMLFGSQTNDGTFAQFAGAVKVKSTLTVDGALRLNENLGMANGRDIYFKNTAGLDFKILGVSGENIYIGDTGNSFNGSTIYGSKNNHIFYVNGVEKARLNQDGYLGLEIDNPFSKVHLFGHGQTNGFTLGDRGDNPNTVASSIFLSNTDNGILNINVSKANVGLGRIALNPNGGNVSIGATTTNSTLDVNGNITSSTGLNVTGYGGFFNSANKFGLDFYNGNSRFFSSGTNTATRGGYEFHTVSSDGLIDNIPLFVGNNLRVGVNNTAPAYTLDINGNMCVGLNNQYGIYTRIDSGAPRQLFGTSGAHTQFYNTNTLGHIRFRDAGDSRDNFVITDSGNILINNGIVDAGFKLDVNGTGRFSGAVTVAQYNVAAMNAMPSTATSAGTTGEIRWTNGYLYLCVAPNTWKRAILATW